VKQRRGDVALKRWQTSSLMIHLRLGNDANLPAHVPDRMTLSHACLPGLALEIAS